MGDSEHGLTTPFKDCGETAKNEEKTNHTTSLDRERVSAESIQIEVEQWSQSLATLVLTRSWSSFEKVVVFLEVVSSKSFLQALDNMLSTDAGNNLNIYMQLVHWDPTQLTRFRIRPITFTLPFGLLSYQWVLPVCFLFVSVRTRPRTMTVTKRTRMWRQISTTSTNRSEMLPKDSWVNMAAGTTTITSKDFCSSGMRTAYQRIPGRNPPMRLQTQWFYLPWSVKSKTKRNGMFLTRWDKLWLLFGSTGAISTMVETVRQTHEILEQVLSIGLCLNHWEWNFRNQRTFRSPYPCLTKIGTD